MARSLPPQMPPNPQRARTLPMVGEQLLMAEHFSWRLHQLMRGREFENEKAVHEFVASNRRLLHTPLPSDAAPADRAQELFYLSREAKTALAARHLREDALQADPDNVDARVDQAIFTVDFDRILAQLEEAVVLGDALRAAEDAFETDDEGEDEDEDEEPGWSVLSARPGLRARAALARQLIEVGRLEDAVAPCREMLDLDPSDHLGARYQLVATLLEVGRLAEAREVLAAHEEETSAILAWAKVLLEWAEGGDAQAALEAARALNEHVLDVLLEPETLDPTPPELHTAGSPEEAEIVGDLLWRAWHRRPEAVAWLWERTGEAFPDNAPEEPVWERILHADEDWLRRGVAPFLLPADEATVTRLKQFVVEGPDDDMPHVAERAALLLHRLGAASTAVPELVAYLRRRPSTEYVSESEAQRALSALGAPVVRPLLDAHAEESDPNVRRDLAEALARTGVHDEEILALLSEYLDANVASAAGLFTDLGDARAIPLLSAYLDRADPDPKNTTAGVADLMEAIEALGGSLTAGQRKRFAEILEIRAHWETPEGRRELEEVIFQITQGGEAPQDRPDPEHSLAPSPATNFSRPDRPGRNDPCWCGSGKKYKRCHLNEDDAASQ